MQNKHIKEKTGSVRNYNNRQYQTINFYALAIIAYLGLK